MGFYNVQQGDAPYFKSLADNLCDERQLPPVGQWRDRRKSHHARPWRRDLVQRWQRASSRAAEQPARVHRLVQRRPNPDQGIVNEIENPNPATGTNNWYIEDGYGNGYNAGYPPPYTAEPVSGGGSYSDCSDPSQPGVGPIVEYLKSIQGVDPHCETGHYYLLNNYNPGWFGNGKNAYIDQNPANTPFTIPPSSTPEHWRRTDRRTTFHGSTTAISGTTMCRTPISSTTGAIGANSDEYCNICNPFQYDTSIMANAAVRTAHIQDTANLYSDITERHASGRFNRQAQRTC